MRFQRDTLYVFLLSIQVGLQPILTHYYYGIQGGGSQCNKLGLILGQELTKSIICLFFLVFNGTLKSEWKKWSMRESIEVGGVLSVLYAVQHFLMQMSYQSLSPTKLNIINQSKIFWTAVLLKIKMQKNQSFFQILSLFTLVVCSVLLIWDKGESESFFSSSIQYGVIPCAIASFLSAYSGIYAQIQLKHYNRDTYLFSLELGIFMSLVVGFLYILPFETDSNPFCGGYVVIPMITNSFGAILVGLLLKHASGEEKGFAIAIGIALTGIFESIFLKTEVSFITLITLPIVVLAMIVHSNFPPEEVKEKTN